ncbi:MAG: RagB/SusD family nutrient uptake outer membrane protein [Parabacteroides sp.]|nr:RagB/SusD family nutrient uptake outer membrane protein [Parabacteroides sp.]
MKKIFIYSAIAAVLALGNTSCSDFLGVKPAGSVSEEDFISAKGVEQLVTGMYAKMHDNSYFEATLSNYVYGDVMGGSANKGSTFQDQPDFTSLETFTFTTDNGYLNKKWQKSYNGVFTANNVIKLADLAKEEMAALNGEAKDNYTETIAQARFFRAFWHFEVVKLFGAAVPYIDDQAMKENVNPQVSNVDESGNYIYIWDKIIEDLQYAYDNLPDKWNSDKGRINKWAAAALLAKVKMYQSSPYDGKNGTQNRWTEVKSLLEEVIANGKDNNGTNFRLADTYEELYYAGVSDWTGESVFDIQMAITGTVEETSSINGPWHIGFNGALGTGGWGFYQPSNDLVNSHIVDANGLPEMDGQYKSEAPLTTLDANNIPHTDLTVYTDPRVDVSAGRFNTPFWDWTVPASLDGWIRDYSNGGLYLNKKNIPRKADKGSLSIVTVTNSSAKNFHLIRYADVLLWYAEALIETGNPKEAGKYINQVRARAANGYVKAADPSNGMAETTSSYVFEDKVNGKTLPNAAGNYRIGLYPDSQFATKESATQALRWERKIEMALEGHRWYDLARWGIIANELNSFASYEKKFLLKYANSVYNAKWCVLPIPLNEIQKMNGLLVQNENWK